MLLWRNSSTHENCILQVLVKGAWCYQIQLSYFTALFCLHSNTIQWCPVQATRHLLTYWIETEKVDSVCIYLVVGKNRKAWIYWPAWSSKKSPTRHWLGHFNPVITRAGLCFQRSDIQFFQLIFYDFRRASEPAIVLDIACSFSASTHMCPCRTPWSTNNHVPVRGTKSRPSTMSFSEFLLAVFHSRQYQDLQEPSGGKCTHY